MTHGTTERTVNVGVLGCGNVGAALVQLIDASRATRSRPAPACASRSPGSRCATCPRSATVDLADGRPHPRRPEPWSSDPDVDVVVEVIGGIEPARELILDALKAGKPVVTANKELLANVGAELFAAADAAGVDLLFEAAVAGGIPLIRPLRESLRRRARQPGAGHRQRHHQLHPHQDDRGRAPTTPTRWPRPRASGYAERDPTADVEGFDAGAKAAIIATIAFGAEVVAGDVYHEGISGITAADIAFARRLGYVGQAAGHRRAATSTTAPVAVRVHPAMVPAPPPAGRRARQLQRRVRRGRRRRRAHVLRPRRRRRPHRAAPCSATSSTPRSTCAKGTHASLGTLGRAAHPAHRRARRRAYYLNLEVADRPGVLAAVAGVFGAPRRVHPLDGAGGPRRRRPPHLHHPRGPRGRRAGHPARAARASTSCARSARSSASSTTSELSVTPLTYVSTRGAAPELGFADVLLAGLATDGGLYVPEPWPDARRRSTAPRPCPTPRSPPRSCGPSSRATSTATTFERDRAPTPTPRSTTPTSCPLARPRRRPVAARAVPRPDARLQGRRPAARRPAVRPRARPSAASGSRSSAPPRATPARPPSTPCRDRDHVDIVILYPARPASRRAAPADDHGRRAPTSTTSPSRAPSTTARTW